MPWKTNLFDVPSDLVVGVRGIARGKLNFRWFPWKSTSSPFCISSSIRYLNIRVDTNLQPTASRIQQPKLVWAYRTFKRGQLTEVLHQHDAGFSIPFVVVKN